MFDNEHVWHAFSEIDSNAILFIDKEGIIRSINKGVTSIFGYRSHDIIGKPLEILMDPGNRDLHKSLFTKYVNHRKDFHSTSSIIGKQRIFPAIIDLQNHGPIRFSAMNSRGQEIPITLTINEVLSTSDELIGFIAIIRDNLEQYRLQENLRYQLSYDSLTGLINWHELIFQVNKLMTGISDENEDYNASILYLDIDYFKTIRITKNRR